MSIQITTTTESFVDSQVPPVTEVSPSTHIDTSNTAISLHSALSRELKVRTYSISDASFNFNPLQEYLALEPVKIKLWNYNRLRCKTRVRFTWSAPVYTSGLGMILRNPAGYTPANSSLNMDHYFFDFGSKQTELVIEIPFINDIPYYDLANYTTCTPFTILQHVTAFQPVRVDTNALVDPVISVYVSLTDVQVDVPVAVTYTSKISDKLSFASKAFNQLSSIPEISLYTKVTSLALGAASSILHLLGFSRPVQSISDHVDRSIAIGNIPLNSGYLDPSASTILDPITQDGDVLSFDYLLKKDGYLGLIAWDQLMTTGTLLHTIRVSPVSGSYDASSYKHTPLSYVSHCFEYWRGSIVYKVKFPTSPFVKGKLLVTIQNDTTISEDVTYLPGNAYHTILDLAEDCEFDIVVPYLQNQPYSVVGGYSSDTDFIVPTNCNTFLNIYVYEPLIAPSSLYYHYGMLFTRAHDDFEFCRPASRYKGTRTSQLVDTFTSGQTNLFDLSSTLSYNSYQVVADLGSVGTYPRDVAVAYTTKIIEFPVKTETFNEEFMGERLLSCRPLLKIFDRYCFRKVEAPGYLAVPRMPLPCCSRTSASIHNIESVTYLEYFSRLFLGSRGSTSISYNSVSSADMILDYGVGYSALGNFRFGGTNYSARFNSFPDVSDYKPFDQHRVTAAQSSIIQNVPMSTYRYFARTMREINASYFPFQLSAIFQLFPRGDSSTPANVTISYAAGEDFNFIFYSGVPPMYIILPSGGNYPDPP